MFKILFTCCYGDITRKPILKKIWGGEFSYVLQDIFGMHPVVWTTRKKSKFPKNILEIFLSLYRRIRLVVATYRYRKGVPYEYIFYCKDFLGENFYVNPSVLIPRPETEELVLWVVEHIVLQEKSKKGESKHSKNPLRILDIGTGSGVIAISIKKLLSQSGISCTIVAVDCSRKAIQIAQKNAQKILPNIPIDFIHADIFSLLKQNPPLIDRFDIVVSNPPYIGWNERKELPNSVIDYEPAVALFSGEDGLNFYRGLSSHIEQILKPNGTIFLETGWQQASFINKIFHRFIDQEIKIDSFGHQRFFKGSLYGI